MDARDILVVGLGISGAAAARYFLGSNGEERRVTVLDAHESSILEERAKELGDLGATVVLGATGAAESGQYTFEQDIKVPLRSPEGPGKHLRRRARSLCGQSGCQRRGALECGKTCKSEDCTREPGGLD